MFGIRHRRIVVVYTLGETTHEDTGTVYRITDDKTLDIERQFGGRESRPLWLHRDGFTHIYPVGSIARLELGTERDNSDARVCLYQDTDGLILVDPDTSKGVRRNTTPGRPADHPDYDPIWDTPQFSRDAYDLIEGSTTLDNYGTVIDVAVDGLDLIAAADRKGRVTQMGGRVRDDDAAYLGDTA